MPCSIKLKPIIFWCFLCIMMLFQDRINAQNTNYFVPNVLPLSPNSTAFAKFGNYPVNMYTGLPDISILLYSIESGGLQVPISLSYHASGIKVSDAASWVGLGWSVNCGGSITRNIMGLPDENGFLIEPKVDAGSLSPSTNNNDLDYLRLSMLRQHDNMPDIYSYQIPGYSGKFFYNAGNHYKATTIPFSTLSITGKFTIKDDHGNSYALGNSYREMTQVPNGGGYPSQNTISAWMLESMISQNKRDTINFTYSPHTFDLPDGLSEVTTVEDSLMIFSNNGYAGCLGQWLNSPTVSTVNNPATVTEQQLNTIYFKNGKVEFILAQSGRQDIGNLAYPSTTVYALDTIKISSYNFSIKKYEMQKSVVFCKSYFNQGIPGAPRLRLDSIKILDKAGSTIQRYRFGYNSLSLPPYLSCARDYWGYFNGKTTITDLIPKTLISMRGAGPPGTPSTAYIGSNDPTSRTPDSTQMQACMLDTIYYPTGGHTIFTYQTNRYIDNNSNLQLAGGLRIASIASYDSPTSVTPLIKTYQYNKGRANFLTNSIQVLYFGFFQNAQTYIYWYPTSSQGTSFQVCQTKRVRRFYAQPNIDLAPDGISVAYSNVTEYNGTPVNNVGKTIYTFRDSPINTFQAAMMTNIPITYDYFFARGQMSTRSDFLHNTNGTYQVVKRVNNTYTVWPVTYYNSAGLAIGQVNYNDGALNGGPVYAYMGTPNDVSMYPFSNYSIISDDNYLKGSTATTYDMTDTTKFVTSTVNYAYDDTTHQQIVNTSHVDSKGNTRITANKYPYNYPAGNAVIDNMVTNNMYAEAIEKTESYTTSAGTSTTASQLNQFQLGNIAGSVLPYKIGILNIPAPVTNFVPSNVVSGNMTSDSRYTQMISFDQYDLKNNISQYTTRNSTPVSILWGYAGELPVAQIKNATNGSVTPQGAHTSFEAPEYYGWSYTGAPIPDVTAPTGSLVYPLSAGSVTLPQYDRTQSYTLSLWSNSGAPVVNTGSNLTGTSLRTVNGWTYYEYQVPANSSSITISGTSSIDELRLYPSAAQMTTYAYDPSGLRSVADTKGEVSYFEYDPFQRLKNVKDWNGNIVKNYGYHTYDQTAGNDAISGTFTRNNCPAGTTSNSISLSMPINTYYSSTKASANAEANYNLQLNANNLCSCSTTTFPFTINNTTVASFTITFSNITPFNNIAPGNSTFNIPQNTYATVTVSSNDSNTHTFTMGNRTPQANVHNATFNNVVIASGSTDLTLTIQ